MPHKNTFALLCLALSLAACSGAAPKPPAPGVKVGKPYTIEGQTYYPEYDPEYDRTGMASWYGPGFHGKKTANGETFDQESITAAHPTLPMPSLVRVTNLENGLSAVVRINDRGPFKDSRIIDLSRGTAETLGIKGLARVRVQYLKEETEAHWASLELKTQEIDFAKNDPHAPSKAEIAAATEKERVTQVRPDDLPPQIKSAAPVMSVASADLTPEKLKFRPVQPSFRIVGDAQAQETADQPVKSQDAPAPQHTATQEAAPSPVTADTPQLKIVQLIGKDGKPMTVKSTSDIKVVKVSDTAAPVAQAQPLLGPQEQQLASVQPSAAVIKTTDTKNADTKNTGTKNTGRWYVQAGSFASEENATKLVQRLKSIGVADMRPIQASGRMWHRVRVGPFADRAAAMQALQHVAREGAPGARVLRE